MLQMIRIIALFVVIFLLGGSQADLLADNIMQINSAQVDANDTVSIEIEITNDSTFVAFQADIPIPEELSYVEGSVTYNPERVDGNHILMDDYLTGDILRIIGYSTNNTPFLGNSGVIVSFQLVAGSEPGNYPLNLVDPIIGGIQNNNLLTDYINGTVTILAPDVNTSTGSLDFGENPLGTYANRSFSITNNGTQDLTVDSIRIDHDDFEVLSADNFILTPYQSQSISIRFNAITKGDYEQTLTIYSTDPDEPQTDITLYANAFAVNELHTGTFTAFSGDTATLTLSINNMEAFTAFQFDLQLPSVLTYVDGSAMLYREVDHQVGSNMINNNTLRVVAYSPSNQTFTGNDGVVVSVDFYVMGTGGNYPLNIQNPVISGTEGSNIISDYFNASFQIAASDIHLSTSYLNFGDVSVLDSSMQDFTIYNYGEDTLEINQISTTHSCFTISEEFPVLVLPSGNYELEVTFSPDEDVQYNEALSIYSNDPDESPKTISLQGNAYAPNYLSIQDTSASYGGIVHVSLTAENYETFTAFQADVHFPPELSCLIDEVELGPRATDHVLSKNLVDSTTLRLIAYSPSQSNFSGTSGMIADLVFEIDNNATFPVSMQLSNAIMGNAQGENILWDTNDGDIYLAIGNLTGTITDNLTGNPISGATVIIEGTGLSANTLSDGSYLIEDVATGIYDVTAEYYGFEVYTASNVEVLPGLTTNLDFELIPLAPNLLSINSGVESLMLEWDPIPANSGGFRSPVFNIYRDGEMIVENFEGTQYTDDGLTSGQEYCYYVTQILNNGMESPPSNTECEIPLPPSNTTQTIDLLTGYRFVSTHIIPENPDMMEVLGDNLNENLEFVRNDTGNVLRKIGPVWINGIGDWITTEGYLFKMVGDDQLSIEGQLITPDTAMGINYGYNFISYLPVESMDAMVAFESIIGDNLDFIRNMAGNVLRKIGPVWVNGIGDANPGEGYLAKMLNPDTLIYPPAGPKTNLATKQPPAYFQFEGGNAADPVYTVYLDPGKGFETGDEIAAFDGDKLIGSAVIQSENWKRNELAIFSTLNEGKGYKSGHPILLKTYDKSSNEVIEIAYEMKSVFHSYLDYTYPRGDGHYSIAHVNMPQNVSNGLSINVYPNPVADVLFVHSDVTIERIEAYSNHGALVIDIQMEFIDGMINVRHLNPGIYLFTFITKKGIHKQKVIVE